MGAIEVTTDDDVDLAAPARGIYIGGAGNLKVTMQNGDVVTFVGLLAGVVYPIRCVRIWEASTATNIVALT